MNELILYKYSDFTKKNCYNYQKLLLQDRAILWKFSCNNENNKLINLVFIIFDVLIFVKMHNFLRHGSYLYVIEDINNPYLELGLGVLELVISTIVENDDKLMFPTDIKTKF